MGQAVSAYAEALHCNFLQREVQERTSAPQQVKKLSAHDLFSLQPAALRSHHSGFWRLLFSVTTRIGPIRP